MEYLPHIIFLVFHANNRISTIKYLHIIYSLSTNKCLNNCPSLFSNLSDILNQ